MMSQDAFFGRMEMDTIKHARSRNRLQARRQALRHKLARIDKQILVVEREVFEYHRRIADLTREQRTAA
jgi:hypothetical protein